MLAGTSTTRRSFKSFLSYVAVVVAIVVAALPAGGTTRHRRIGVGDSIMLSAEDDLAPYSVVVNAEVGRQFSEGFHVVRRLSLHDRLPRQVVVHLGTNGYVDPVDCDELVRWAGPHRHVFLVTVRVPRAWEKPNNDVLHKCAGRDDNAFVIRWCAYSDGHPEWFAEGGYHLNEEGQAAFAAFLDANVDDTLAALRVNGRTTVARYTRTRWPARADEGARLESV
jgi:hypothetical protein